MALSNSSDLPAFFSSRKSISKFLSIPAYDKPESLIPRRWLQAAGFIKSSFEIPARPRPGFGQSWQVIFLDLTILRKPSSGSWPCILVKSSSGIRLNSIGRAIPLRELIKMVVSSSLCILLGKKPKFFQYLWTQNSI
jgi:hypothetical protein